MEESIDFLPMLLIMALAFVIPFLSYRLTGGVLPAVAGEVVIGMIVGEPLLGWLGHTEWLDFLALFGFAYLMFLSGLEINLNILSRRPGRQWYLPSVGLRHPLVAGVLITGLVAGMGYVCLLLLERTDFIHISQWPMLLFIFMATSVGVLVPVLKDRPDLGNLAQAVLVSGFLLEFVAIIGVGVVASLEREGISWRIALLLAMPAALGLLLWTVNSGGGRIPVIARTLHELAETSSQLKIRGALVVLIAFVALSQAVGTELVLGAFIAGLAATAISPRHGSLVRVKLDAFGYGFFVPIFFIHAGATLDVGVVFHSFDAFIIAPIFLLIAFAMKMIPALIGYGPVYGLRKSLSSGALLSANLSLVLAAGAIAEELGIVDEATYGALLLMALATTVVAPPLFSALAGRPPVSQEGPVVLIGDGDLTRMLAPRLAAAGRLVVVIAPESVVDAAWRAHRIMRVEGDPVDPQTQRVAGLALADVAVIADTGSLRHAERIAAALRRSYRDLRVVTWVEQPSPVLEQLGVETHLMTEATALALENSVLHPGIYHALSNPESGFVEVTMRNQTIHGRELRELRFIAGVRVVVLSRAGDVIVAEGDTTLMLQDRVTLAGEPEAVAEVSAMLMDSGLQRPLAQPNSGD